MTRLGTLGSDDPWLGAAVVAYAVAIGLIGAAFDPTTHRSTGIHQEVGEYYVEQSDITGFTRFQFLCSTDYDEPFTLCAGEPAQNWSRYTVCGTPRHNPVAWFAGIAFLATGVVAVFGFLLRRPPAAG